MNNYYKIETDEAIYLYSMTHKPIYKRLFGRYFKFKGDVSKINNNSVFYAKNEL